MNKNAISKFAVWARRELISRVRQKAEQYGITESGFGNPDTAPVSGRIYTPTEKSQRTALIERISQHGFNAVVEEVAYTWFNRFIALRFMEVNGFLPSYVRVFSDEQNNFRPEILRQASSIELDGLDKQKVFALKSAGNDEELFKYLLITQCNALHGVLPFLFQKIADYTELLFPDFLLRDGSVIDTMLAQIPEADWLDGVQIIGWLYQYYNSEPKDAVFENLKKNIKISKTDIPAATQLFTPDWIVRYMVENSLGRFWLEGHPHDEIKSNWRYYLDEAAQSPETAAALAEIRKQYADISPEEIACIDPCSGSGHVLVYMFEVLLQIYQSCGYAVRDAVRNIVEKNLYGLDLDERAAQLSYFAVVMLACRYDKRFLTRNIQPHIYPIRESNNVDPHLVEFFANGNEELESAINTILAEMTDAKEYGSLIKISIKDFAPLYARFAEIENGDELNRDPALEILLPIVRCAELLSRQYDAVVTNPPYMGGSGMDKTLSDFVKKNYPDSKADLFACFIERGIEMAKIGRYNCMVTMQSWMFLSSFEELRVKLMTENTITNLMHMENMVMGIAFGTAVSTFKKTKLPKYKGTYNQIKLRDIENSQPKDFPIKDNRFAQVPSDNFAKIPGSPVAYWASKKIINAFVNNKTIGDISPARVGLQTGCNDLFLRQWVEVSIKDIAFNIPSTTLSAVSKKKWFPHNKGGEYRKWYGNNDYVVNWKSDGSDIKNFKDTNGKLKSRPQNTIYYFKESVSWSDVSSGDVSFRYKPMGFIFDTCAPSISSKINYLMPLLNSKPCREILSFLAPTIHFTNGAINKIPLIIDLSQKQDVALIAQSNIAISREDWDAFETSWDFKRHPLIRKVDTIEEAFLAWEKECAERFRQLKANEEELNRIFIEIYDLQDELTPDVEDKDVTVRKADLERDIKSFISYAVGCMFGRYSLDADGLAFAGGEWDESKYKTFPADKDAIIPVCDREYFEDDIVARFADFVKALYGAENLEKNLKFISRALGGKEENPRKVIREYFIKDFFADHCKIYQKRPIYWLFDSGKKNAFKALIYIHRYKPDTIARLRTGYLHEVQAKYAADAESLEKALTAGTGGNQTQMKKELSALKAKQEEMHVFEEKIHHYADIRISIDLDDGVKHNYALFADVLAKLK